MARNPSKTHTGDGSTRGLRALVERPWFWPAAIFVLAFALRVIYTLQVRYTPFFLTLGLDAKFYDQWAGDIARGTSRPGAFFMTPLYPYFLAAIYRLFGRDLLLVRMIQAGLGSASAVLVYLLGSDVFDRRVGVLSGLVMATYGAMIFYDCSVLLTPLLVFLTVLAVFLLVRADLHGRPALYLASGAVLGLAAVGRAAALVLVPVAALWVWLSMRRTGAGAPAPAAASTRRGGERARRDARRTQTRVALRAVGLLALGVVLVVAPVTIRNFVASRDFVLITSNGGLNFYIGNGEAATGGYVKPEGLDIVTDPDGAAIAEAAVGRDLKPSEVSAYWYARARAHIASAPGAWAKLLVRKLSFVMSSYELPQLENYYFQKRYSPLLKMPLFGFAVVAPLGLVGLGLSFRRRRSMLLGLLSGAYLLSIAAFFVVARYRLPVVPVLIVLASYAVFELVRRARAREWPALVIPVVAAAALAFLVNVNIYGVDRSRGFAQPHFRLGIIYQQRGMVEEAIAEYAAAIELDPDYPKTYLNLGVLYSEAGRMEEAIDAFQQAIAADPGYSTARVNLAMAYAERGEYQPALSQVEIVLRADPHHAAGLKEKGILLYRMGRPEEAVSWLRESLVWDEGGEERGEVEFYLNLIENPGGQAIPEEAVAAMEAADSLARVGRVVEAIESLELAARLAPRSGEPLRRLALVKRDMGLSEEAVALIEEALRVDPVLEGGHFMAGVLFNEMGRHDDAIREYQTETRINPDFASPHLNLALTYNFHAGNPNLAAYHYRRYLALGGEPVPACEAILRDLETPNGR